MKIQRDQSIRINKLSKKYMFLIPKGETRKGRGGKEDGF